MIHTRNLQKIYQRGEYVKYALQNINVDINEGEYLIIHGPSGSGKTTLLGLLGLIDAPSGGEIFFKGTEVGYISDRARDKIRRNRITFVFEKIHLLENLTVSENIALPLMYSSYTRKEKKQIVHRLLDRFRLTHLKRQYPSGLGNLMQQKIALARACCCSPDLILADEPCGKLSSEETDEFMELFRQLNEEGQTIVVATHSEENIKYGQRVLHLFDGHVVSHSGFVR
ncbi:ABC transporter ATP-binding protein [Thermophagus xiamenensis]|jgi:putative ABC transport system ATP-binding protein|uniref:ABC-type lipoprotein export system, ATPase component n=1 Tax=Thermophagus xiamenensis TaxID=385682 RepID=A0A1I2AKZ6_9BACT|nr:ATP-binding cassette domain-containing protein [Thermophagus xiamenensis]SFE44684.1 ABC-type lipoprotein export system, ATPase component [Thermophagus xiamenensis]